MLDITSRGEGGCCARVDAQSAAMAMLSRFPTNEARLPVTRKTNMSHDPAPRQLKI